MKHESLCGEGCSPGEDRYLGAKLLELGARFLGKEGKIIVGLYGYLRWADDVADEQLKSFDAKKEFLDRQRKIIQGQTVENLTHEEHMFCCIDWGTVPVDQVREKLEIIMATLEDDAMKAGGQVRTQREIRHYNWRTMGAVMEIGSLILGGKTLAGDRHFYDGLNAFMELGNLEDIGDDFDQGAVKVPIAGCEGKTISRKELEEHYNSELFNQEKKRILSAVRDNVDGINSTEMPEWFKAVWKLYIFQAGVKRDLFLNRNRALMIKSGSETQFQTITGV